MVKSVYELDIYQTAYKTALEIHKLTLAFPKAEQFALASQMRRASKGICANIAEGFAKSHKSQPEFRRFLLMALGSSEEMVVWLDFTRDLEYASPEQTAVWIETYQTLCRQINVLINKVS